MRTSPRLVTVLAALTLSGATMATAAPRSARVAAAESVPACPQRRSPAAPAFNTLPKAHLVAAFLLGRGGTTFYTGTRGRIIGRSSPADGSRVAWSDHSRSGTDHRTRIAW